MEINVIGVFFTMHLITNKLFESHAYIEHTRCARFVNQKDYCNKVLVI